MANICRVRNLGSKPLLGAYDSQPYRIDPGETAIIDVECAKKDFGDWECRNFGEGKNHRLDEYHRIRGLMGVMEGARVPSGEYDEDGRPVEVPSGVLVETRLPKVEIHLADGTKVVSVLEDPEGRSLPVASELDQTRAIESMQEEIKKLSDALDSVKNQQNHVEIPKDAPSSKRPSPKKPEVVGSQVSEA